MADDAVLGAFVHPATLLNELGGRARRRFGQNFLAAEGVVREIVAAAEVGPGARVVEVGPGLGVVTGALLARGVQLTAVELDRDLVEWLQQRFAGPIASGQLRLISADAAKVDWAEVAPGEGWTFVSNLPYNVGTGIVTNLLDQPERFPRLVVMLQREVGLRMLARPGDRARGSLSVFVEARAKAATVRKVPPGCFHPPPKIHSLVLRLDARGGVHDPQPSTRLSTDELTAVERVCRTAFSAPRKTLARSLRKGWHADAAAAALDAAELSRSARPATLTLSDWVRLTAALGPAGGRS
jgi:16S rRNA (adenine1518-N6/adenine1519-N6)-dimethyltransferase